MMTLQFNLSSKRPLEILCLGCHSDDIEIGCGGTILRLAREFPDCNFNWVVFSAIRPRDAEARQGAKLFAGGRVKTLVLKALEDGFMPYLGGMVKTIFEKEIKGIKPDVIFSHNGKDAHQDHRLISELTWNTFRNHLILEYEIPKYDGDLRRPSIFVPLDEEVCEKKISYLMKTFHSQQTKRWFQPDMFRALMRLRGMECNAESGYAEAFYCRKLVL